MRTDRLATTNRLFLAFLPFWLFLGFYKLGATLHYTLLSPLGGRLLPLWIVGFLVGSESFFQMLLDVPSGFLVDRFGRKRMLFVGWFAFVFAALLLTRFSLVTYVASIIASVIGWLFYSTGSNAYVLSYARKETSGRFMALRDTFFSVGVVLASVSLPFVLRYAPSVMGVMLVVIFILALVALILAPPDRPIPHAEQVLPAQPYHIRRTAFAKTLRVLRKLNPASGMLCVYRFASAIFYGSIWFIVPLIIATQVHNELLGIGLAVFDAAIMVLGVAIGTLVDRGNKRLLIFYGLSLFALMGLIIGTTFGPLFILFGFLATTGDETAGLSLWSWLHELDKEHAHDGAVAGAVMFSNDFGYAVGSVLAGLLFSLLGPGLAIAACALPLFLTWVAYVLVVRPFVSAFPLSLAAIPPKPMWHRHKS